MVLAVGNVHSVRITSFGIKSAWLRHEPTETPFVYTDIKLGRYHNIIEYRDTNLETISISDRFCFNRNIDISQYRLSMVISIKYRDVFPSRDILHPIGLE